MSDQNSTPIRPKIRIFNPHRLKPHELEESFIARQELFRSILDDVDSGKSKGSPQHQLVIGQRGMGKTTLLRRLALELHREPYCRKLLPLNFPEEQYVEVDRLSKFWLNCLDATADALEFEGQTVLVARIDDVVKRLAQVKTDETTYNETCREAFTAIWKEIDRRPVLFIDNFNLLLSRLRNEDYSLRGYFSAAGAPILVAASTVYPDQMEDYGAAFYDGFKTHYLYPLTLEEVRDVLIRLAHSVDRPGLVDRIYRELPRLAALRDLTGGNPRTAVLLFELFADGFSEDAFEDLDALLDLVTPLYQSRLDQLSDLAQTIVGTLARHWSPMSKSDIVSDARLIDSSVPPQLGRLKEIGLVEETPLFPSKKTGYQIAERFFNIWYLMRFASRRQRASLACLTRFLEEFHTPAERTRSARELIRRNGLSRGNITYAMALAGSLPSEPALARELEFKAQLELIQQMEGVRERIAAILDPDEIPHAVYSFVELKQRLEQAVPSDSPISGSKFVELVLGSPSMVPDGVGKSNTNTRSSIAASKLSAADVDRLTAELTNERDSLYARFSVESVTWLRERLNAGTLTSWCDDKGLNAMIELADDPDSIKIIRKFGHPAAKRKLSDAAFERLSTMLELRPSSTAKSREWYNFAIDSHFEFGRFPDAEYAYRQSILLDRNNSKAWRNLGVLLEDRLLRFEESEEAYREAIRLDLDNSDSWYFLGDLLHHELSRYVEAEQAYREAIRISPDKGWQWRGLGILLQEHSSRLEEAEEAYREALRLGSDDANTWNSFGNLLYDCLGRFEEACDAFRRANEIDADNGIPRSNLAFLLRDIRHQISAAREVLQVRNQPEKLGASYKLHEALFAAYEGNWTQVATELKSALSLIDGRLPWWSRDDWFRASSVLLHLGYGERFVELLRESGAEITLLPWFAAVRAHSLGDKRHLVNLPVEARPVAEEIFDEIQRRRQQLPKWRGVAAD